MAWGRTKTEHCGPKKGKGHWGRKAVAKATSKRSRRREDRDATDQAGSDDQARPAAAAHPEDVNPARQIGLAGQEPGRIIRT
jgi:hypothetical protein